jgi:hypothetical protein
MTGETTGKFGPGDYERDNGGDDEMSPGPEEETPLEEGEGKLIKDD